MSYLYQTSKGPGPGGHPASATHGSMPRLSQKCHFLQSPSFWQAHFTPIGQLTQCIVIGRTPQARVGNVTTLTIITTRASTFKLALPSFQAWKGNRVAWQTPWWCSYVFAVHKPRLRLFQMGCRLRCDVTLFPSHTQTRYTKNSAFEQSIANT